MHHTKEEEVVITLEKVTLNASLVVPKDPRGIVLFAHGSGSSRFSPRNKFVAEVLQDGQIATLLLDLLTASEEEIDIQTRHYRFDIMRLATRLVGATEWIGQHPATKGLGIGYFGSSTGAAAALVAAAEEGENIRAVVSRGGRPDLAGQFLPKVYSPTLLIVGGDDNIVIGLNQEAFSILECEKKMEIIPGATHLFEEQGALEEVARLARIWFTQHL